MTYSYTTTSTNTFTRTHAQYVASKVAADLRRMKGFYGCPSDDKILDFYKELVEFLIHGYLVSIEYGFQRNNQRIVSLKYSVSCGGALLDSHAGGIYARADVNGADWFSTLIHKPEYERLSLVAKQSFHNKLPFVRSSGQGPCDGQGYWVTERSYSQDGRGVQRLVFRPY